MGFARHSVAASVTRSNGHCLTEAQEADDQERGHCQEDDVQHRGVVPARTFADRVDGTGSRDTYAETTTEAVSTATRLPSPDDWRISSASGVRERPVLVDPPLGDTRAGHDTGGGVELSMHEKHHDRLRQRFDEAAELYDRARPGYPPELVNDLCQLAEIGAGSRVLEIGPGTGQLTLPLATRGCAIVAVELGAALAAVAQRNGREPLPPRPGTSEQPGIPTREDYEYERKGTVNLFLWYEPLRSKRHVEVTAHRKRDDWAHCIKELVDVHYPDAEKIVLVLDNLNIHSPASLYVAFEPKEAKRLADKLEIHRTPKHGSWLNAAEIELAILSSQCLARRLPDSETLQTEITAWEETRNQMATRVNWRFTAEDARIKLKHLYPSHQS